MNEIKKYESVIEKAINATGVDPASVRGPEPGQWNLQKGEHVLWVDLWTPDKAGKPFFQVLIPVMTIPSDSRLEFYRELLEINNAIFVASFALHQGNVLLKTVREAEGLTAEEVASALHHCAYYAEYYSARLLDRFNGKKLVNKTTDSE